MPVKITPRKGRDGWPAQVTTVWEAEATHMQINALGVVKTLSAA